MKVAFVLSGFNACRYWRMIDPARAFPGAELIFSSHGFGAKVIDCLAAADFVQMHYACLPEEIAAIAELRRRGVPVAIDYDDNLFQMFARSAEGRESVLRAAALADVITVSCEELRAVYANSVRGVPVRVIPNLIDTERWRPALAGGSRPVIAYAGSRAHARDFASVETAVWNVLRSHEAWILRTIGLPAIYVPPDLCDRVEQRPWVPAFEVADAVAALDADIAIAPLIDTPFNRGRSPLKWVQFGALGVPVVAAAIPPYEGVIRDGYDGYLAADLAEWETRLGALMDYPRARLAIGDAARRRVVQEFGLERDREIRTAIYAEALEARAERIRANSSKGGCGIARAAEPASAGSVTTSAAV